VINKRSADRALKNPDPIPCAPKPEHFIGHGFTAFNDPFEIIQEVSFGCIKITVLRSRGEAVLRDF
jgi:hypothetical protein